MPVRTPPDQGEPLSLETLMPRRAADLIVDCLAAHGVDRVFCVPGESYSIEEAPVVVDVKTSVEQIAPFATIGQLWG
jgi:hypothetical protein